MIIKIEEVPKGLLALCRCDECGKKCKKWYSHIKNTKHQFCSHKCRGIWQSKNILGNKAPNFGNYHSEETKIKMSKAQLGEKNHAWNDGKYQNKDGYILVKNNQHSLANKSGYVLEHRLIMEQLLKDT